MKKKILILGASILQIPAIKRAKQLGYYVGVADYDKNAKGIQFADEFFNVSTIDEEKIIEISECFQPDGIITIGTDMPMRSIALATEKLKLPGITYATAINSTDKGNMMKIFRENNISSPWFYIVNNLHELNLIKKELTYPCILKPTDNSGSRGVVLVNSNSELTSAFEYSLSNSKEKKVIIEEYMEGPEVSVEIMAINGYPNVLAVTDKSTTGKPHFVEVGHSQPSRLSSNSLSDIKKLAINSVKALNIENGPAHVEIILTESGPKMVELGSRLGGGFIASHLVLLSTGIDMIEATIKLACNDRVDISEKRQKGSAVSIIKSPPGKFVKVTGIEDALSIIGVKEIIINKKEGDIISELKNGTDRLGFIIAEGETVEEAVHACDLASEILRIETR